MKQASPSRVSFLETDIGIATLVLLRLLSGGPLGIILDQDLRLKVVSAIRKGAHHGLLKKGVGICHGVAGSIYALLAASQVLNTFKAHGSPLTDGNAKYLRRAVPLAVLAINWEELTQNEEMSASDCPWSLYEGFAGMCCAWGRCTLLFDCTWF